MKAVICERYGPPDLLTIKEVATPAPRDNELLIKVCATTVTSADYRISSATFPPGFALPARLGLGWRGPRKRILGVEFAGIVMARGRAVTNFEIGDRVFGINGVRLGAHAEYMRMPANGGVVTIPDSLTFEDAASLPFGAMAALSFLRDFGKIKNGDEILIYGASGAVGVAGVQLARHFGATVTGVCGTTNMALVKSLGASIVIDYTKVDCLAGGRTYDQIFETVGQLSFARARVALKANGRFLPAVAGLTDFGRMLWTSLRGGQKVVCGIGSEKKADLLFLKDLVERGRLKPVIDRRYPLEQIADAYRYVASGRKKGSVVVTVADGR
jgi:NADPH:quinone reductase-like Zn-dependent oxidoreductase